MKHVRIPRGITRLEEERNAEVGSLVAFSASGRGLFWKGLRIPSYIV